MAYDNQTYGASPFGKAVSTTTPTAPSKHRQDTKTTHSKAEALSDHVGESPTEEDRPKEDIPALPADYTPQAKPLSKTSTFFYIPKGRVTGLNLLSEALGWLMAWGTVGFFRAYVPAPILTLFDKLFTPYGMASITLLSALLLGQLLRGYQLKLASLRQLATAAIEYGETHHQADVQSYVYELLSAAEEKTATTSRWLVSWLTGLGCLFIIGAFY
ncbi:MAG: hypothetical protein AAF171_02015 [Cyanobacteria bacterium P01_A01_bin.116]